MQMTKGQARKSGAKAGTAMARGDEQAAHREYQRMVRFASIDVRDIWQAAYREAYARSKANG